LLTTDNLPDMCLQQEAEIENVIDVIFLPFP